MGNPPPTKVGHIIRDLFNTLGLRHRHYRQIHITTQGKQGTGRDKAAFPPSPGSAQYLQRQPSSLRFHLPSFFSSNALSTTAGAIES